MGSTTFQGVFIVGSIGIQELTFGFFGLVVYAIIFFCVWKFYQILSKINDNIVGIRIAVERSSPEQRTGD
jgi:hypothetical protein